MRVIQPNAQSIQIFLPNGDPTGIKKASIHAYTIEAFEFPRPLLKTFFKTPGLQSVALYILFGEDAEGYDLCLMSGLPKNGIPEEGKIYIDPKSNPLKYTLVGLNGEVIKDKINPAELNVPIERYFVCKNQLQYLEKPLKF